MKSFSIYKVSLVMICFLGVFSSACVPSGDAPSIANPPPCTPAPSTPGTNVYSSDMVAQVDLLYSRLEQTNYDFNTLQNVKNEAFTVLLDRVQRWSSSNDIPVGEHDVIRITLTYLSPDLLQFIILNHQLHQLMLSRDQFQEKLKSKLEEIAERDELIFLITITYSRYDQIETEENMVVLKFPVKEIVLINSGDKHIKANHFDPPLEHEIVISRGPLSGYIAFPMNVAEGENCLQVLEHR